MPFQGSSSSDMTYDRGKTYEGSTPDGADDGIRTRDPNLGKVVLYQLSHVRVRQPVYPRAARGVAFRITLSPETRASQAQAQWPPWRTAALTSSPAASVRRWAK